MDDPTWVPMGPESIQRSLRTCSFCDENRQTIDRLYEFADDLISQGFTTSIYESAQELGEDIKAVLDGRD